MGSKVGGMRVSLRAQISTKKEEQKPCMSIVSIDVAHLRIETVTCIEEIASLTLAMSLP